MSVTKDQIRKDMRKILVSLDDRWTEAASREICRNLSKLLDGEECRDIKHILAWTKFFPGEVDLAFFIAEQLGSRSVFLPRTLPDLSMKFISIGDDWSAHIEAGPYGIPEPVESIGEEFREEYAVESAIIVPGLAFDRYGNRLGRGKGFYDRFLGGRVGLSMIKIGVCWNMQLLDSVPMDEHDIPVDYVCHECGIIKVETLDGS